MAGLPYAAWVSEQLAQVPEELRQEERKGYYNEHGRIVNYDRYKAECKRRHRTPDAEPDGYYEYYSHAGHHAASIGLGLLGIFGYLLIGLLGGAARPRR